MSLDGGNILKTIGSILVALFSTILGIILYTFIAGEHYKPVEIERVERVGQNTHYEYGGFGADTRLYRGETFETDYLMLGNDPTKYYRGTYEFDYFTANGTSMTIDQIVDWLRGAIFGSYDAVREVGEIIEYKYIDYYNTHFDFERCIKNFIDSAPQMSLYNITKPWFNAFNQFMESVSSGNFWKALKNIFVDGISGIFKTIFNTITTAFNNIWQIMKFMYYFTGDIFNKYLVLNSRPFKTILVN